LLPFLRVVEALRRHAAVRGGLPVRLADIQFVPVPNDPITAQAFAYRLIGETAHVSGPPHRDAPFSWEISPARP
jgi:hypothetical protein